MISNSSLQLFLEDYLKQGNYLAEQVSQSLDSWLQDGCTNIIPDVHISSVEDLTTGGKKPVTERFYSNGSRIDRIPDSDDELIQYLQQKDFLNKSWLFEDIILSPAYPVAEKRKNKFCLDDNVYYYLPAGSPEQQFREMLRNAATTWYILGVGSDSASFKAGETPISQMIFNFVENADILVLGLFDGEGYMIIERTS